MTDNMFGYQICFGRKQHKKARWKKARKRWILQYAKLCEKLGVQNDLQKEFDKMVSDDGVKKN